MRIFRYLKERGLYLVVSLIFSVALFSYVATTNQGAQNSQTQEQLNSGKFISSLASQRKVKLTLPLQLDVDSARYFVTGAPENVTVRLIGPTALVTAAVNTKNFEVYANLRNLTLGNHTVALKIRGLSKDISAEVIPERIAINLAQRSTRNLPVKVQYNEDNVADGYDIGETRSSVQTVQVTGPVDQINRINQIVAQLPVPNNAHRTITQRVPLQALDAKRNVLDIIMTPQSTVITLPITPGKGNKLVPVVLKATGSNANNYTLTATVNEVNIEGKQQVLNDIKQITVDVDVSGITAPTTRDVKIAKFDGVDKFNPTSLMVNIQPNNVASSNNVSSSSSATSSSTASSSASSSSSDDKDAAASVTTKQNNK